MHEGRLQSVDVRKSSADVSKYRTTTPDWPTRLVGLYRVMFCLTSRAELLPEKVEVSSVALPLLQLMAAGDLSSAFIGQFLVSPLLLPPGEDGRKRRRRSFTSLPSAANRILYFVLYLQTQTKCYKEPYRRRTQIGSSQGNNQPPSSSLRRYTWSQLDNCLCFFLILESLETVRFH